MKKANVTQAAEQITWKAIGMAQKTWPFYKSIWLRRWLSNRLPESYNLHRWKRQTFDNCPVCGEPETNHQHFLECTDERIKQKRKRCIEELESWMMTRLAHPEITKTMIPWLSTHEAAPPLDDPREVPRSRASIKRQITSGKTATLKGLLQAEWVEIQEEFLKWNSRRTTGERWVSRLIKKLWEVAWDLWQLRIDIVKKGNTAVEALIRQSLRQKIDQRYSEYQSNPLPSLTKWFSRSKRELEEETIENQTQWIQQIDALRKLHDIQQPTSEEDSD